ncbi:hypothetical protein F25303_3552 [Fusarium sp. NRRL 25303]|nr:hypothetical protein F25303_3552 [Fusarium sp. NRRL 25303]
MDSDRRSQLESCSSMLAAVKLIEESAIEFHRQLLGYQVLSLKDDQLDLDNRIRDLGQKLKQTARDISRKAREEPVTVEDIEPYVQEFTEKTNVAMGAMLAYHDRLMAQAGANLPPTPATDVGNDGDNDAPLDTADSSPPSPHPTLRSPPASNPTSPDAGVPPFPNHRARCREITTAEIGGFSGQKITETPAGSAEWYLFQCEEHSLRFDGLPRPAQAAARHAITYGLPPTSPSAIEAFGIKIAGLQANRGTDGSAYRPQRERRTDEMASLLGDINPSHPRHIPIRQAAVTRKRTIVIRELDGTEKPSEITAKTIYWIKWPDDGLCYPAYGLPWESFPRFRSKYLAPVDRGLLETVDELPACYDRAHGLAGVWAEGYKDGQRKMNKRVYPVIFFALGKRFPWECETAWAAEEDFRVFDGDREDPQFKALVDHWKARENRQTPDDELIRLKLMSPPGDQTSSDVSSSVRESSQEMSPENGNIDDELRNSFMELNDCLGSDRGSKRAESPNSDDEAGDIGDALVRDATESESRFTSAHLSQHMPQRQGSETHRCGSRSMSVDNGPPTGRLYPDEDEDSDIYGDDNVGPFLTRHPSEEYNTTSSRHNFGESPVRSWEFSDFINGRTTIPPSDDEESLQENESHCEMNFPSSEVSSGQRADFTVSDEDVMQVDEPSTSRERASSSEQRLIQAVASAARQTSAVWRETFREHSEEVDKLL